jgi:hypothetical protein
MNGPHLRQQQTWLGRLPCHHLIPWPNVLARPMEMSSCLEMIRDRFCREVHLDGICVRIGKLPGFFRDLEGDWNDRPLDLETLLFHGIEEYSLYFSLMQGCFVWIARGRGCYIRYTSYALIRVPLRR